MKYQTKWGNLDAAKTEARHQSRLFPKTEYSIIQSVDDGNELVFYVEDDAPFIRNWETNQGYYLNGKHHKP